MIKILFVCYGNICRSPMAEFMLKKMVNERNLQDQFEIQSAATSSEETGNDMYGFAKKKLDEKNIPYEKREARRINKEDYEYFDYIIGMETKNCEDMIRLFGNDKKHKVHRLLDFSSYPRDIADPWYTGNFEVAYQEIQEGLQKLLQRLIQQ